MTQATEQVEVTQEDRSLLQVLNITVRDDDALTVIARHRIASTAALRAENERLRGAIDGIADDYMTSEEHHPGYVLIPTAKFQQIAALATQPGEHKEESDGN